MPADILFITSEQSVVFGADVKLNCWSKGVPAPDVAWMRNEKVLVKGERTVILKLDNVTWQDEDVYTCIANNSGGSDSGETKVNVVGGCLKLPNRIVPNCCFGCHATLLERSVAWPISGATAHGIVMLIALLENKRTVFFFTVVFFLFQRVHRRAAVFLQPMNYELIANLQIWLLFHSTSRWLLQKCKFIYFHCKSWLISYKIIVDYCLSYLDSDLSDNKIEALNVEDLTSLNFLHKLLVMFTIYNYCFPRLIITYTLTKDLALYLIFFFMEKIDQINHLPWWWFILILNISEKNHLCTCRWPMSMRCFRRLQWNDQPHALPSHSWPKWDLGTATFRVLGRALSVLQHTVNWNRYCYTIADHTKIFT